MKYNIPKEVLYQKYIIEKNSAIIIGKELNVSTSVIRNRLRKYKIQVRSLSEARRVNKNKGQLMGFALLKIINPNKFKEIQDKSIESSKEYHKKYREEDPEGYSKRQANSAKMSHIKHPDLGKRVDEINRKNNKGIHDPKVRERAIETNKKLKKGLYDPKIQSMGGKIAHQKHPDLASRMGKLGGSKGGKKAAITNKKNGTSIYGITKEQRIKNGKIGGSRSMEKLRENSPYIWQNVNFMSKAEMKVAQIILNKPILDINCHIKVNGGIIDFYPQKEDKKFQGKFVEYHPRDWNGLTPEEYYNKRRKLLDENGFKDKELIVIDNQKFIKQNGGK